MNRLLFISFAAIAALAVGQSALKADRQVKNQYTIGRDTIELVGGCTFLGKVECWDMAGKRRPDLVDSVIKGVKDDLHQIEIGFRMTNRLVIYKKTTKPFFPKGSIGGNVSIENRMGEIWLGESRRPGEKGAPIQEEMRALVTVVPKGVTSLSVFARTDRPTPEVSMPFREGASIDVGGSNTKIVRIRQATTAEKQNMGRRPAWIIEMTGSGYPTLIDDQGMTVGQVDDAGKPTSQPGANPASFMFLQTPGELRKFLITVDPQYIKKLKFQGSSSGLVEITGAPANPR